MYERVNAGNVFFTRSFVVFRGLGCARIVKHEVWHHRHELMKLLAEHLEMCAHPTITCGLFTKAQARRQNKRVCARPPSKSTCTLSRRFPLTEDTEISIALRCLADYIKHDCAQPCHAGRSGYDCPGGSKTILRIFPRSVIFPDRTRRL